MENLYNIRRDFFGNYKANSFPILMKIIDAKYDLSVQIHPIQSEKQKSECWYVLDLYNNNKDILIGHNALSRDEFREKLKNKKYKELFKNVKINIGDYFYIKAGTIHAIKGGTKILEVSQASQTTYRAYDYNRGNKRELHINEVCNEVTVPDEKLIKINPKEFFIDKRVMHSGTEKKLSNLYGDYIYIISGNGYFDKYKVKEGDFIMISSNKNYTVEGELEYIKVNLI